MMKAVIPVAGAGIRLRPLTYTQPKPLIPVAGKAIVATIIDQMLAAGISEFVFIIGHLGEKIKQYIAKYYPNLNVEFVNQEQRLGIGHAIWTARDSFKDCKEIVILLGDTILDLDLKTFIENPVSSLAVKSVDDPRQFGVVELDDTGQVIKVEEKPKIPRSNLALVGLYKISDVNHLITSLEKNIINEKKTRGEYQLTDGLMNMIGENHNFTTFKVNNWFDCGRKEILLETNKILLRKNQLPRANQTREMDQTIIIEPVAIGENCHIKHSIIGPNVSIGNNVSIDYSIITESIISNFASIHHVILDQSIVGTDATIKGMKQSLNVGDNTEIDFS